MFRRLAIAIALVAAGLLGTTLYVSQPLYSEQLGDLPPLPVLADRSDALTIARATEGLFLITGVDGEHFLAINLSARFGAEMTRDALEFYKAVGYEALEELDGPEVTVKKEQLSLPVPLGDVHLAAGTNYAEHADEVLLEDPPFLFPKLTKASPWNAPVKWCKRLDYEAELAAVPLARVTGPADRIAYALILSNDFTDRLTLLRELDFDRPMGTTGFAAAKGRPGFLPVGPWVLIPRRADFYRDIEIRLYVNGRLRQRFRTGDMILSIDDIVRQSFAQRSLDYRRGGTAVDLLPADGLHTGHLILTGTAGGVVFKPLNIWWQGAYLAPGDVVRTEGSYLGFLENTVVSENDRVSATYHDH